MRNAEKKKRRQSQLLGRWSCNFSQNSCCLWAIKRETWKLFFIRIWDWSRDLGELRLLVVGSATRLTHTQPHNFLATNVNIKKRNFGLFIKRVSDSRLRGCTKILIQLYCKYFPLNSRLCCLFISSCQVCTVLTVYDYLISPRCQSSCVKSIIDQSQTGNDLIFFIKYRKKFIATASNFCNMFCWIFLARSAEEKYKKCDDFSCIQIGRFRTWGLNTQYVDFEIPAFSIHSITFFKIKFVIW